MKVIYALALLIAMIAGVFIGHDQIIAHFSFVPEKVTESPVKIASNVKDIFIKTSDGLNIHSLYFESSNSHQAVLFFHGNAGNIYNRYQHALDLNKKGVNVLLVEYRGYGRSEGEPTEPGLYLDGEAAYQYLLNKKGFKPANIYILGRSIGSTVAMQIAQKKPLGGIILVSPLSTGQEMANLMGFGWLSWFANSTFDNVGNAKNILSPVLIIHGDNDSITPLRFGESLYNALPDNKKFILVKGGDHNGMIEFVGPQFWDWVYDFIREQ